MITIIAAIANKNALGKNNQLIWHLPEDLKRFKKITSGHPIIMGRKTFESLGRPLPNRTNIVITRNKEFSFKGAVVVDSLEKAIEKAQNINKNIFIIGGANIYKQAILKADRLDVTLVHHTFDADVFFPKIDTKIWKEVVREDFKADEKNHYDYSFVTYEKMTNG